MSSPAPTSNGAPNLVLVDPPSSPDVPEIAPAPTQEAPLDPEPVSVQPEAAPSPSPADAEPSQAPPVSEAAPEGSSLELLSPVQEPLSEPVSSLGQDSEEAPVRLDQAGWEAFVEEIRKEDAPLAASLDHSQVVSCDQGVLTLGFRMSALTATQVEDARRQVLDRLRGQIGPFKGLKLETLEQIEHSPFQRREIRTAEEEAARRDQITNHPAVQTLVTRFDGELRRVMTEREAGGGS